MLRINEIFYSIQGESSFAGLPCVFIRLTGCNLRCAWCDTSYSYEEGMVQAPEVILETIQKYPCRLVELTGGEPLLQKDTPLLAGLLLDRGYTVLVETNGSQNIDIVDPRCHRIMDIKCPSSGESGKNDLSNLERLTARDEVKFVIGSRGDYDYARALLPRIPVRVEIKHVHFSPLCDIIDSGHLAGWMLEDGVGARLSPQLHKIIWPDVSRGV